MNINQHLKIFKSILHKAWPSTRKTTLWLLKLMIPISFAVTMLKHFGILQYLSLCLNPIFEHLGLPGSSAVVFLSGAAAGTYAGIAAMMSVQFTLRQATIIGIMIALCHALPMECSVNKKTGSSFWKMGAIRILMAFVCAFCLNIVLPEMNANYIYLGSEPDSPLPEVLITWALSQLKMSFVVLGIIYALMTLQRLIEAYSWLEPLSRTFAPLMRLFGLPRKAAYMWLVGNVLGISYGSAVMLELKEKGLITDNEANDVNYHLIMNHSLIEDTIVFAATGISALWIIATRVVFAIILVWSRRLILCFTT